MGNKEAKKKLAELYKARCFLTDLKTQISYHHITKKCRGGQATIENGALLNRLIHDYLHLQETENRELYDLINESLQLYKKCLEEGKDDCLEIWEDVQELARQEIKVKK